MKTPDISAIVAAATAKPKPPLHNSKAVMLNSDEVCARLGISRRTLDRRLREGWRDGYWFFKVKGHWFIRESHLEELITLMESGKLK
ncbi:MAG: helix-turn-helix domain-containing protein [Bacteroidales bacterium]|nr:helix-turn-helix domain-containing protein [Bacteroidales bacterium]